MQGKHRKTLAKILRDPIQNNIRWDAIEVMLRALGSEVVERQGSRVMYVLNGIKANFHRPHPVPDARPYQVKALRDFLRNAGVINMES